MHKKEVKSFLEEQSVKEEAYVKEAEKAGFDNMHDYESMLLRGVVKWIFIWSVVVLAVVISLIYFYG